ncbi:MAG: sugar phosphate isomerase/epimerase [Spirochaetales bacterium]|jgi:sugar phosphate isomerase/epimerase|nr:sugar phosphate isomerase/epimerase [Spirochaetales bacterium]
MKLGLNANVFGGFPLEKVCQVCGDLGVQAVELKTPGYPRMAHLDVHELLADESSINRLRGLLEQHNLFISAIGCAGNHVHPREEIRVPFQDLFKKTIVLAEKLGINKVTTFSGCPGDCAASQFPNWVTCPWPEDYLKVLEYQWNDVLFPYWCSAAKFALDHGVKICIEMHPGFNVYNPETFLKLRGAAGESVGLNFDPSHLFWQGIDPVEVIAELGETIFHVHIKDSYIDKKVVRLNGVLDTKHYKDVANRAWTFRTVGYGHSSRVWKDIISALRITGYDYVLSIEHEDCLMSREEGLKKAVSFLRPLILTEPADRMWWA